MKKRVLLIFTRCYFHSISLNEQIIFAIDPDESKTEITSSVLFFHSFYIICFDLFVHFFYEFGFHIFWHSICLPQIQTVKVWQGTGIFVCQPFDSKLLCIMEAEGNFPSYRSEMVYIQFVANYLNVCILSIKCVFIWIHTSCIDSGLMITCSNSNFDFISCLYCALRIANCWASCQAYSDPFHDIDKYFPDLEVSMINLITFEYAKVKSSLDLTLNMGSLIQCM